MRKLIILTFVLFFAVNVKAQPWCAQGAQWHYRMYNPMYFGYANGYIQLNNTGTITVGGKVCDNLVGNRYGVFIFSGAPTTTVNGYANVQTYRNNNVVYMFNTQTLVFDTMVNFNATIGDKWQLINYPGSLNTSTCSFSRPICTVTNTSTVIINSQTLKKLHVAFQMYNNTYTTTIIEKIGGVDGFLFPYYHCIIDGPGYGSFVCYSDNNFALYNPSGVPCNYTTVGINELKNNNNEIKLYPNPTNGILNMASTASPTKIEIINVLGELVKEEVLDRKLSIDISTLQNGIYFLKVFDKDKLIDTTKIVKE